MCGLAEQPLTNTIYNSFRTGPAGSSRSPDPVCRLFANFVAGERATPGLDIAWDIAGFAGHPECWSLAGRGTISPATCRDSKAGREQTACAVICTARLSSSDESGVCPLCPTPWSPYSRVIRYPGHKLMPLPQATRTAPASTARRRAASSCCASGTRFSTPVSRGPTISRTMP